MKQYIRNYLEYHNLTEGDFIGCKMCGKQSDPPHHIHIKGMGGRKKILINGIEYHVDDPINLIPLCREHHSQAHTGKWTKQELIDLNKS